MFALASSSPPNTALHRTPAAAPLSPVSFQTFGDWANRKGQVALAFASFLIVGTLACATHTPPATAAPPYFGKIVSGTPFLPPETLSRVTKNMTMGQIFRTLGPAHAACSYSLSLQPRPNCWRWYSQDGQGLEIEAEPQPSAKPRTLAFFLVDGGAADVMGEHE